MKKSTLIKIHTYLKDPVLLQKYTYIKERVLPIKPSQYDISDTCNLFCEGCFYFLGEKNSKITIKPDTDTLNAFFKGEADRGVNYAHFGGAEPGLTQEYLHNAYQYIQRGTIYSNGTIKIDPSIKYRIQLSIWGSTETDSTLRGADIFKKVLRNYMGDKRALFLFTISRNSLGEIEDTVRQCADNGMQVTFNHFSPTREYIENIRSSHVKNSDYFRLSTQEHNLLLKSDDLLLARDTVSEMISRYPDAVVYNDTFNQWVTNKEGLYDIDPDTGWATNCASRVSDQMRHYLPDLTSQNTSKCCTPNTICSSCRNSSMALASAVDRLEEFSETKAGFEQWLEIMGLWSRIYLIDTQ